MKQGTCKVCGEIKWINNTRGVCPSCVYKRNHGGLTELEYSKRKRSMVLKDKKPTGELDMFIKIWEERPHVCVECGKRLGDKLNVSYFSHRRSKGAYPELRLVKSNIDILCTECHHEWDFGDRTKMKIYDQN